MAFLKSGLDALLGQVLRRLGLEDAQQLTITLVRQLERQDLLDLGHHLGLELDERTDAEELAEPIWRALHAAWDAGAPTAPARKAGETIPWGYGRDRVTGIPVDPNRLYVYWEVTDEAIATARRGLGPGGEEAWLNLRIYETTGRLFDGTNAHDYFDHKVGREDRQWFFDFGKQGSEAFVEVGMKAPDGYFVKIARSGRIEFPRSAGAAPGIPDWMTVRVQPEGMESTPAGRGGPPAPGGSPVAESGPVEDDSSVGAAPTGDAPLEGGDGGGAPGAGSSGPVVTQYALTRRRRIGSWSWQAGPFQYRVDVPGTVTERFVGGRRVYRVGGRVHVVYGPWEVVIRGVDARMERTVLARWETYRSQVTEEGEALPIEVEGAPGSSERLFAGASGWRWLGASEWRLGGASEAWYLAASEIRLGGASEHAYLAASERMLRGASERLLLGASERRLGGASDELGGASEYRFPPLPQR